MTTGTHHLSSTTIVERYLTFFRSRGHTELPGSSLVVPGNSTSFIIAGMQPLLPYLRGQAMPPSRRLTALQRCLRTVDVEAVGTNKRKNTQFHMYHCGFLTFASRPFSSAYSISFIEILR